MARSYGKISRRVSTGTSATAELTTKTMTRKAATGWRATRRLGAEWGAGCLVAVGTAMTLRFFLRLRPSLAPPVGARTASLRRLASHCHERVSRSLYHFDWDT